MIGERAVEHQRPRAGVLQEVEKFLVDVAVVDVERCHTRLERADHGFEILVAVVEVDAKMILAGLPIPQLVALGVDAESPVDEEIGEPTAAVGELPVADAPVAEDDGFAVGNRLGDGFVDGGEIEGHGVPKSLRACVDRQVYELCRPDALPATTVHPPKNDTLRDKHGSVGRDALRTPTPPPRRESRAPRIWSACRSCPRGPKLHRHGTTASTQ